MSVYPYVRPHGTTRLSLDRYSRNLTFDYFSKIYLYPRCCRPPAGNSVGALYHQL